MRFGEHILEFCGNIITEQVVGLFLLLPSNNRVHRGQGKVLEIVHNLWDREQQVCLSKKIGIFYFVRIEKSEEEI